MHELIDNHGALVLKILTDVFLHRLGFLFYIIFFLKKKKKSIPRKRRKKKKEYNEN